jgi:hypothetical protein
MQKNYLSILFIIAYSAALAQLAGWNNKKYIIVYENSGMNLVDYQLKLTLNTQLLISAGQMNPDGSDIRFAKSCSSNPVLYNYWIESGINTPNTIIWVKVDTLKASQYSEFIMYYDNSLATAVSAVGSTFSGPYSSTDSVASGSSGASANSQRGFRFSPNEDLLVTHFGKREPNGTPRFITLFDQSTQAILVQTIVNGAAAQYNYQNISNPIWLSQGTEYQLQMYNGSTDGYYFGASSQIGQHLTYYDMRYCNSCTQNTFPTSALSNSHYGYPDLWYYTKNTASVSPFYAIFDNSIYITASSDSICPGSAITLSSSFNLGATFSWSNGVVEGSYFIPSSTNTYVLTETRLSGCLFKDSIEIVVYDLPNVTANTSASVVCYGDSVTLTGSGADTYTWDFNTNGVSFPALSSSTYIVTGTDSNGCMASDSVTVIVNFSGYYIISATAGSVCTGDSVTLSGLNGSNYIWNNGIANGVPFAPSSTQTYTVIANDTNGCIRRDSIMVIVEPRPVTNMNPSTSSCSPLIFLSVNSPGNSYSWNNGATTESILITNSGNYIVVVTSPFGCTTVDSILVALIKKPIAGLIPNVNSVCEGAPAITLVGTPAGGTYSANAIGGSFNPITAGTFTTSYMVSNVCGKDTADAVITVNANPLVSLTVPFSALCAGTSATLTGLPANGTYSVVSGSASALVSNIFNATTTGNYTINYTFTNAASCSDSAQFSFNVNCVLGLDNTIINNSSLTIFPNPNSGMFTVNSNVEVDGTIELINELGQVIYQNRMNGLSQNIDVQNIAAGIYHLKVTNGSIMQMKRMSIVK